MLNIKSYFIEFNHSISENLGFKNQLDSIYLVV